jgi:hypothetical protein
MTKRQSVFRGLIAAGLTTCAALPLISVTTAGPTGPRADRHGIPASAPLFDFAAREVGWIDDFEHFAASRVAAADTVDTNVVVVVKVEPGTEAPSSGQTESIEPKDIVKQATLAPVDDPNLATGAVQPKAALPILPPVPGPDAFKVHKGDRLISDHSGVPMRLESGHNGPANPAPEAAVSPHAELSPAKGPGIAMPSGKSAMFLATRGDRLKTMALATTYTKPFDLSPGQPDAVFQGPPMPADPAIDPDAPVLGYADQMATGEAPFKALFAVTPVQKRSWLAVGTAAQAVKSAKPVKTAHAAGHRKNRKHEG